MLIEVQAVWDYQSHSDAVPVDPTSVTVPFAGWTSGGLSPFGHNGSLVVQNPVKTDWPVNTGLWVRRNITTDGLAPIILKGRVENACLIYVDGQFVGAVNQSNANLTDSHLWHVVIPATLVAAGTHQIAVKCFDEVGGGDGNTYFYLTADYTLPMIPNQPEAPAKETLEWMTEVQIAKNGTEVALQLRQSPRQMFAFTYPVNAADQPRAYNTIWGARHSEWLVPVWPQGQRLGAVAAGLLTLPNVLPAEYRKGQLALLWQDVSTWQIIGVDQLNGSDLLLHTPTQAFSNAWVMPLRTAVLANDPTKQFTGFNSTFQMNFQVEDNEALTVAAPTQYLGYDVYTDQTLISDNSNGDTITGSLDSADESTGAIKVYANWAFARNIRTRSVMADGQAEAWALRQWLHRRAGKYNRFWEPSFEADLRVQNTGTVSATLIISADEYQKRANRRTHIAVETSSGWLLRSIISSLLTGPGVVQLTLNSALGVAASDIRRVCWLGLKRLNSDSVDIDWIGGGVCQSDIGTLEITP